MKTSQTFQASWICKRQRNSLVNYSEKPITLYAKQPVGTCESYADKNDDTGFYHETYSPASNLTSQIEVESSAKVPYSESGQPQPMSFDSQDQTCTTIRVARPEYASALGSARNKTTSSGPYDSNAEPSFVFHKETPRFGESTPLFQASKDTGMALGPGPCHAQRMSCVPLNRDNGNGADTLGMVNPQKYSIASSLRYQSSMMTGDTAPFQDTNSCTLKPATGQGGPSQTAILPSPDDSPLGVPDYLEDVLARSSVHLCETEKNQLAYLLIEYKDVFAKSSSDLGRCDRIQHAINTGTAVPVRQPARRLPFGKREAEQEEIARMLDRGVTEPSNSPWSSPVVFVTKKDGSIRFCVDYRVLNSVTFKDAYLIPRVDECLDALSGSKWYSSMDLNSGF